MSKKNKRRHYHEVFENFHPGILDATDRLFRARPWTGPPERLDGVYGRWLERAARTYRVDVPDLTLAPSEEIQGGGYEHHTVFLTDDLELGYGGPRILLPHHSVLTLFYGFRIHLQRRRMGRIRNPVGDARSWSHSLYFQARPELYMRAAEEGKFVTN